ncbi:MAG TPA: chromosomal replication initiator protein DnaA [Nitriliruptorales bacterium]|nr:chromosomal replication initiator protein DnaA [Nitriliruptorales bacterium]
MAGPAVLDLGTLWEESLADVHRSITSPAQRRWLDATRPVGYSDGTVVLAAPHTFAREWLDTRCGDQLRAALSSAAGRQLTVVITVQPIPAPLDTEQVPGDPRPAHHPPDGPRPEPAAHRDHDAVTASPSPEDVAVLAPRPSTGETTTAPTAHPLQFTDVRPLEAPGRPPGPTVQMAVAQRESDDDATQLVPKYVFDRFVIGASNRFAHAAAFAVAEAPARAYNPLFIYGGAGLGKTHLLHAIGHYVRSLYPRLKVRYVTTEQFTNAFIDAIRGDHIVAFQRTFRQADVLLIDDIQFLERAERTQEEFFHTFNALHNAEKQIVISSDRPPKQIARLEDRLRSRFEWGLMTDVQPPDLETRIAILKKKSTFENLPVPNEVLELIASKVQSNIRELEGALLRVTAFASLQQTHVDADLAEMVLKDLFPHQSNREIGVSLIQEEVADFFALTVEDLCSPSRSRQLVTARQIAMYLIRELTDLSLPRIGRAFGGRDHTTVMHAVDKIGRLMQERRAIFDQVQELSSRVKTRARNA